MQLTQVKTSQGVLQNVTLNKALIVSLKESKDMEAPENVKKTQRSLFLAAVAFENSVSKEMGISREELSRNKSVDLSVIVELLEDSSSNTDYIVQNLIEFLRVISVYHKVGKHKPNGKKYAALLRHLTKELEAECSGGECSIFYNEKEDILTKALRNPIPNSKEVIHDLKS